MNGDDGFYYLHEDNELQGAVLKLNDFQFLELIISWNNSYKEFCKLTVPKVEYEFWFNGLDIQIIGEQD